MSQLTDLKKQLAGGIIKKGDVPKGTLNESMS